MSAMKFLSRVVLVLLATSVARGQDLEIVSGASFSGSGTFNVKGNITNSGIAGATTIGGSVNMNATTGNQTIGTASNGSISIGSLTVSTNTGGTTTSAAVAVAVTTALSVSNGSTFAIGANALTLSGSSTLNTSGLLTSSTGSTVTYNQTGSSQTILPINYGGDLVLSGTATKSVASGTAAPAGATTHSGGDLTISNGATLTLGTTGSFATVNNNGAFNGGSGTASFSGTYTQNNAGAQLTAGTGTLDFNGDVTNTLGTMTIGSGKTMNIFGSFTNAGTLDFANSSTVTYDGTSAQSVIQAAYGNLVLSGSAKTIPASNTATVNTLLTAASSADLTITGGLTLGSGADADIAGNLTNNGTFTNGGAGSVVTLNGAGQTIDGSSSVTFRDLTLAGSANKTASTNITVNGTLTPTRGVVMGTATLEIASGGSMGTFGSLVEISGALKINPTANTTYTLNNASTSITFSGGFPATYSFNMQPGTNPTGYVAADYVNRKIVASYTSWSAGTATLNVGYRDTEVDPSLSQSRLKYFVGSVAGANKLTGTYSRTAATGSTFGSVSLPSIAYNAYASGAELIVSDLFSLFTSTANANWNVASTWDQNAVPGASDDVEINSTVTVPDGYAASALTLVVDAAKALNVGSTNGGTAAALQVVGGGTALTNNGALSLLNGHSITVTGKLRNAGALSNNGTITIQ